MTIFKIGGVALVRAEHAEIAKAKLTDESDNPAWLDADVEVVRVQGPEEILLIADAPQTKSRRKHK